MPHPAPRPVDPVSRVEAAYVDVSGMRERHARTYIRWVQPITLAIGVLLVIVALLVDPSRVEKGPMVALLLGAGNVVACLVALRRFAAIHVAAVAIAVQTLLLLEYIVTSSAPDQSAPILLWPIIVAAYFGTPNLALALSVVIAIGVTVLSFVLDDWPSERPVPTAAYVIAVSGMLIGFVTHQGRRIEQALAAGLRRDRVALRLARSIRLADDPIDAMHEIARTLGDATEATCAVVFLFEQDGFVSDVAAWWPDASGSRTTIDATDLDATLRHLVSTGLGAVLDARGTRLTMSIDSGDSLPACDSSVDASMRSLIEHLGGGSGVVAALAIGVRTVGAIMLVAGPAQEWDTRALPLLDTIAPQLAAGLAQVVLVRDQRDALESFERLDRMRDRLIANVSHELRTPLTSTIGFIETLLREDVQLDDEERRMLMEHARDGGRRLLSLVEDLLSLGSTYPRSLDLDPEPISTSVLVRDALRGIPSPPERGIQVRVVDDVPVTVDRNRMLQVFSNLVVNAIHHGTGNIEIECSAADGLALVDVIDDGPGVAPEHVPELFLPFARFSTRSDSTGLGLAICRAIVEAHGGSIDYERLADERTRFRVRIPVSVTP